MRFISAETGEDLDMLAEENPVMEKAVNKLLYVSADEKLRVEYEMRLKTELDYHSVMTRNFRKGVAEGEKRGEKRGAKKIALMIAKNLLKKNMAVDDIADATGLSKEEIENINASG